MEWEEALVLLNKVKGGINKWHIVYYKKCNSYEVLPKSMINKNHVIVTSKQ